ncbi:type VI secretion system ImpM family protein [Roseibium hamelinense]|uniref:Type VI secretion system ImpM family protein n=1 Tax=Roseibium hamelinense TaxID=150831 RepID=A0A562SES2_9HYPH|nr:type VI secretion system-associated protein TagF [Roseibium hamelinense]MTI42568.1 type VI secretion system-associated protein TagF [Roseibium hamelinense]TWI79553.1 type VI secretion system ImpM family protein [Roseibium hamelinense]
MLACGYFGKRPHDRDFLFDGLPARVTDRWAQVMASWMHEAKTLQPNTWKHTFLQGPIWRFALGPGHLDDQVWIGILAASVDTFGREFPFAVLISAEAESLPPGLTRSVDQIMDRIERDLLIFLDGGFNRREFVAILGEEAKALRQGITEKPTKFRYELPKPVSDEFAIALTVAALEAQPQDLSGAVSWQQASMQGKSPSNCYWWHEGTETRAPELCVSLGLPTGKQTAAFFSGDWMNSGWRPRDEHPGFS